MASYMLFCATEGAANFPCYSKITIVECWQFSNTNCNSLHKKGSRISAHHIIEHGTKASMELTTYISVELPNEAGEVVVLEVPR
jgi:hypothetical protein